jgi:hypothetical protein
MTAVSRVSAAQPDAFWLACERGCDTLLVHDSARQEKCLALQEKSPLVRFNAVLSVFTSTGFA